MRSHVQPFALDNAELEDIERFATKNGLENIARLCAELRTLRGEYIALSARVGRQSSMIQTLQPDPHKRFAAGMDHLTRKSDAPPIP